jgi:hypothetical protein
VQGLHHFEQRGERSSSTYRPLEHGRQELADLFQSQCALLGETPPTAGHEPTSPSVAVVISCSPEQKIHVLGSVT